MKFLFKNHFLCKLFLRIETNTYNNITIGIAMIFNKIIKTRVIKIKNISMALFLNEKLLNFKEKRGISAFINTLKTMVIIIRK